MPVAGEHHQVQSSTCNDATCQHELQTALNLIEKLKKGRTDDEEIRKYHVMLQRDFTDLRKDYENVCADKKVLEESQVSLIADYTAQSEERDRIIEELKKHVMQPRDLEMVRLKIIDELGEEQDKKWAIFDQEVEKYRSLYYKSQRECDALTAELERRAQSHLSAFREHQLLHEEELRTMENQIASLQTCIAELSETDTTRRLTRENGELELKCRHLLSELEEVRQAKDSILSQKEQQIRLHCRQLAEEQAISKSLQSDKEALLTRLRRLEAELQTALTQTEEAKEECGRVREESVKLTSRIEQITHEFNIECSDMKMVLMKERNKFEQDLANAQNELQSAKCLLQESNESNRDLTSQLSNLETKTVNRIQAMQTHFDGRILALEGDKEEIQRANTQLRQQIQKEQAKHGIEIKEKELTLTSLRNAHESQIAETAQLRSQITVLTAHETETRIQFDNATSRLCDLQSRVEDAESARDAIRRDGDSIRERNHALDAALQSVQKQLSDAHDGAYRERKSQKEALEAVKTGLEKEHRHRQQLEEDRSQLTDLYEKTRAKSKQKIAALEQQLKEVTLASEKSEAENARLRTQLEAHAAKRRQLQRETRKRHADYLSLLRDEGLITGNGVERDRERRSELGTALNDLNVRVGV